MSKAEKWAENFEKGLKSKVTTVRFTPEVWEELEKRAVKYGISSAEAIRRCVEYFLSEDKVLIPLSWRERGFIENVAQNLRVDPTEAVRMILLSFQVLASSGLLKSIKPIDELLEQLKSEGKEIGNSK